MPAPTPDTDLEAHARGRRLDSWKEIAGYLNRHVTTIRRWEKDEGLPVHRHRHAKLGSIYAYTRELDAWFETRRDAAGDPTGFGGSSRETSARFPLPPLLTTGADATAFTGRDQELDLIRSRWERTSRGQQQVVVVSGEAGVGKTRLVQEFAGSIGDGANILVGRCDREALVAYAPWVVMLQWLIRTTPGQALQRLLTGVEGRSELAHLVPEIGTRVHVAEPPVSAAPDGRRYRLFDAVSHLLGATAERAPLLLIIDDLHWADPGSLLLLRHLLRSTRHAAICVVLTHRNDVPEWSSEFRDLVDTLRTEDVPIRIRLHRLSDDDIRTIVTEWTGRPAPAPLMRLLVRHTEGNPLFVVELMKHLEEVGAFGVGNDAERPLTLADVGLPEGIRQLLVRRLERLAVTTRRLLTIAAVMGREFRLPVIEGLVSVDEDGVLDAMDDALTAGIIVEEAGAPGCFSFTHTLIREVLYTSISAARRVRLHHRIATAIEQQPSARTSGLTELAYHFGEATADNGADKAFEYATLAADRAAAALAFESAAHWYAVALRALDAVTSEGNTTAARTDLHLKRGRSFFAVGQWGAAQGAFEAALSLLHPADRERRCELLVRLAETAFWLMDIPALRASAGEALTLADQVARDDLWADAQAWLASAMVSDGDVPAAIEMDRAALVRAGGIRSFGLARTPLTLYWAGRAGEAIMHGVQGVEAARAASNPSFLLYALQHLALSFCGAGRFDESLQTFEEARAFGRSCGSIPLLARATSMSVAPLLSLGDLDGAMARALEARDLGHRAAFDPPIISAGIDLLMIHARQGEPGRADALLKDITRAVQSATGWHAWKWNMRLSQAEAELALASANYDEALRASTRAIALSRARHRPKYHALGLIARARAAHRLGMNSAQTDAREAVSIARRLADPAVLLEALTMLLDVDGTEDVVEEARRTAETILRAVSTDALRTPFLTHLRSRSPGMNLLGRALAGDPGNPA